MDHHAGRITIIASSTMVHQRVRCMICGQPVDHRVVFMTNDARVLHAGCIPDHVRVPTTVLLQAIRRLERMVARARTGEDGGSEREPATATATPSSTPTGIPAGSPSDLDPAEPTTADPAEPTTADPAGPANPAADPDDPDPTPPRPGPGPTPPGPGTGPTPPRPGTGSPSP